LEDKQPAGQARSISLLLYLAEK